MMDLKYWYGVRFEIHFKTRKRTNKIHFQVKKPQPS
jgi:hypothetical protein